MKLSLNTCLNVQYFLECVIPEMYQKIIVIQVKTVQSFLDFDRIMVIQ